MENTESYALRTINRYTCKVMCKYRDILAFLFQNKVLLLRLIKKDIKTNGKSLDERVGIFLVLIGIIKRELLRPQQFAFPQGAISPCLSALDVTNFRILPI